MRLARNLLSVLLVVGIATACDDDDPTEVNPLAQFEGTWTTTSWVYTLNANTQVATPNLIQTGFGFVVSVDEDGGYTGTISVPTLGLNNAAIQGQITVSGDQLTIADNDPAIGQLLNQTFTFTLVGNTMTLTNPDSGFDFGILQGMPDGVNEEATLELVLSRS